MLLAFSSHGYIMQVRPMRDCSRLMRIAVRELLLGPIGWLGIAWAFRVLADIPLPSSLLTPDILHSATLCQTAALTLGMARPEALHFIGQFSADIDPLAHPRWARRMASIVVVLHRGRGCFHENELLTHSRSQRGIQAAFLIHRTPLYAGLVLGVRFD